MGRVFSEGRFPPRIKSGAGFFQIMPQFRTAESCAQGKESNCITRDKGLFGIQTQV